MIATNLLVAHTLVALIVLAREYGRDGRDIWWVVPVLLLGPSGWLLYLFWKALSHPFLL